MTRASSLRDRRGFAVVALYQPRDPANVGSVLRAAGVFGAASVMIQGQRYQKRGTDTMAAYRHLPLLHGDLHEMIPFDCVPVAVEVIAGARPLPRYTHPERAFYVFGPEDNSIPPSVLSWCRDVVTIPAGCLNLAAAVNVVLYDRMAKQREQ